MTIATVATRGFGSFGDIAHVVTGGYDISSVIPTPATPGRSGLGGDDIPYRRSPHRGWDREEWLRRKAREDSMLDTIKAAYGQLVEGAPESVQAEARAIIAPVAQSEELAYATVDWKSIADDYDRTNRIIALWHAEQERLEEQDEEDLMRLLS